MQHLPGRLHPAATLHGNASVGHLDPRLNTVREKNGDPLLRATGTTSRCKSEWGDDAAWDMNGNLDEWVDDGRTSARARILPRRRA